MKRLVVGALLVAAFRGADAEAVEVTGGALVNPLGYIAGGNVELGVGEQAGVEISGAFLAYEYEETGYRESGDGPIAGVRARYYPQSGGNAARLWLAGGLSAANVTTYWEEFDGAVLLDEEEETNTIVVLTAGVGYKVLLADERFVVDPQLFLGFLTNAPTDTNVIAGLGLSAGVRF